MDGHGYVGDHLVVDELVPLGEHHIAVQGEHLAKLRGIVDVDLLVVALLGVEVPVDPQAVLHIGGMKFTKPQFHQPTSWVRMLMCSMSGSSGPVMEQPLALAYWMYSKISLVIRSPGARMGMPGG